MQYIVKGPILDLCEEKVRRKGTWVAKRWWEQEELDLVGERVAAASPEEGGGNRRRRDKQREYRGNKAGD